ncbi:MAG: energy-coupling factor transporter transmembrane protein EcfT, partial [Lachnospiraceae bacterium]|nr:energy-coupling factor transporter transmembrane protein EcfT [Lachnospiraceae bacterium]
NVHSFLDPRTKLLLLFTSSVFVVGNAGEKWMQVFYWILVYLPVLLLVAEKEWKAASIAVAIYVGSFYAQMALQHDLTALESALALMLYIITKILPTVILARYIVKSTKVSEFLAAMNRMHVTDKLTIPVSVIFRFFPTVAEESKSINDAMRMRGIEMGAKKATGAIEYRMVPLIASCSIIGEELSAAAMTRGLDVGKKRSCIWNIRFGFPDLIVIALCLTCFIWWGIGRFFV